MTAQKKILDLTGSQYLVQKVKSAISDVDSSLSTHIADTDIHVTTADKTTWNTVSSKANDSDVVHNSGDESVIGSKRFGNVQSFTGYPSIRLYSTYDDINVVPSSVQQRDIRFTDKNNNIISYFIFQHRSNANEPFRTCWRQVKMDGTEGYYSINFNNLGVFYPENNNAIDLGGSGNRWKSVYATNYYYGNDNVEFSDKFVTTDTNQTISGNKTFGNGTLIVNNGIGSNVHGEIKFAGSRSGYIVADNAYDGVFDNANCGISILLQDVGKPLHIGGYKIDSNGRVFADNTNKTPVLSITSSLIKTATLVPDGDTANQMFRILSELSYANGNLPKVLDVRFVQYDDANASSAIYSNDDGRTTLGVGSKRWSDVRTYKVNGVEPSSLSLPDLSNGIDISSYITHLDKDVNNYTPPSNGWLSIRVKKTSLTHVSLMMYQTGGLLSSCETTEFGISGTNLPVIANKNVEIYIYANSLASAIFYPDKGNV